MKSNFIFYLWIVSTLFLATACKEIEHPNCEAKVVEAFPVEFPQGKNSKLVPQTETSIEQMGYVIQSKSSEQKEIVFEIGMGADMDGRCGASLKVTNFSGAFNPTMGMVLVNEKFLETLSISSEDRAKMNEDPFSSKFHTQCNDKINAFIKSAWSKIPRCRIKTEN